MKIEITIVMYSLLVCLLLNGCSRKKDHNKIENPKLTVEHKETKTKPQVKPKIPSQQKAKEFSNTNLSAKINEINDLLLNDSALSFSTEDKLKELLKKMKLELMPKNERLKEGINNITEAANKVFDLSRPLSENDIEDLKKLDPHQLKQLIEEALETDQNVNRNLLLCEIGLNKSNPLDTRGYISFFAKELKIKQFESYNDLINYQNELIDECNNIKILNKDEINMAVNISGSLSSFYWNTEEYEKAAKMAKNTLEFIDKLPPTLAILHRGGSLLSATTTFARAGQLDKALTLIEESKNLEMEKNSKRRLLSEEYKTELNNYCKEYHNNYEKDKLKF